MPANTLLWASLFSQMEQGVFQRHTLQARKIGVAVQSSPQGGGFGLPGFAVPASGMTTWSVSPHLPRPSASVSHYF